MQKIYFIIFSAIIFFTPVLTEASFLYLIPQSQDVWRGDSFIAEVWLDTDEKTINSAEGQLVFPKDKLQVIDISEGGSVLSLWLEKPSFSNEQGLISFAGGIPNGFSGQGRLFSMTFKAIAGDFAELYFRNDSRVLLHDGRGTFDSLSFGEASYQLFLKPENLPQIISVSHPDQNQWYAKNNLDLRWKLIDGTEYSYLLSRDPLALPDETADKPEGSLIWMGDMAYKELADGIYYFHLRQGAGGDWTPKITYRAMIDMASPEPFQLEIAEIEGKKYLVFNASDNTSGVDYYEVKEGDGSWSKAQSPYLLEDPAFAKASTFVPLRGTTADKSAGKQKLSNKISVRAVDRAGNERLAELAPESVAKKQFPSYLGAILIALAAGIILFFLLKIMTSRRSLNKIQ